MIRRLLSDPRSSISTSLLLCELGNQANCACVVSQFGAHPPSSQPPAVRATRSDYDSIMRPDLSLLTFLLAVPLLVAGSGQEPRSDEFRADGFLLGVQAWSFHRCTAMEAIERTAMAGGRVIEFFPGQKLGGAHPDVEMGPGM